MCNQGLALIPGRILCVVEIIMMQIQRLLRIAFVIGSLHFVAPAAVRANAQEANRNLSAEKEKKETCAVAGTVVALAGGEPIKGAVIRLKKADDENQGYTTPSDASG